MKMKYVKKSRVFIISTEEQNSVARRICFEISTT